jgi:hypothetical protein
LRCVWFTGYFFGRPLSSRLEHFPTGKGLDEFHLTFTNKEFDALDIHTLDLHSGLKVLTPRKNLPTEPKPSSTSAFQTIDAQHQYASARQFYHDVTRGVSHFRQALLDGVDPRFVMNSKTARAGSSVSPSKTSLLISRQTMALTPSMTYKFCSALSPRNFSLLLVHSVPKQPRRPRRIAS